MLVFDRPSFSSLFRLSTLHSTIYIASPFHFIQMHNFLVADVRLAGMLDTHPCFISPFLFCLIGRCSRCWSPGAEDPRCRPPQREDPRCRSTTWRSPMTRSSLEVPRQEALPF